MLTVVSRCVNKCYTIKGRVSLENVAFPSLLVPSLNLQDGHLQVDSNRAEVGRAPQPYSTAGLFT